MTDSEQDIRPVTNYQKPKKNRGRVFRRLSAEKKFCVAMLCIFVLAWAFYLGLSLAAAMMPPWEGYYITGNKDLSLPTIEDDDMKVILAVGCDKRPNDVGRTDTILLAFVDPKQGDVKVLSIPRDTYVTIPGSGKKTKINHAYAYGGIPLTEETIESAFGIKVDNFMEINFQGFTQVIDALGGIEYDVEKRMYTPWENIDLQPGMQTLNGKDALGYVRFRDDGQGDIGRIGRQQKFLSAVADQVLSISSFFKIPKLVDIAMKNLNTDLSKTEMLALANTVLKSDLQSMELMMLPGEPAMPKGVSYWMMDEEKAQEAVDYLYGRLDVKPTNTDGTQKDKQNDTSQ